MNPTYLSSLNQTLGLTPKFPVGLARAGGALGHSTGPGLGAWAGLVKKNHPPSGSGVFLGLCENDHFLRAGSFILEETQTPQILKHSILDMIRRGSLGRIHSRPQGQTLSLTLPPIGSLSQLSSRPGCYSQYYPWLHFKERRSSSTSRHCSPC